MTSEIIGILQKSYIEWNSSTPVFFLIISLAMPD
jgi:hypothetical protein